MPEYINRPHVFPSNVCYYFLRLMFIQTYELHDLLLYRASVSSSDTFDITLPNHFEITSTVTKNASNYAYCYYKTENFDIGSLRGNGSITVRDNVGGCGLPVDLNTSIIPVNSPTTLKYEYNNGTHTLSANGQSGSGNCATSIGKFKSMNVTQYTVTDLKIKPL